MTDWAVWTLLIAVAAIIGSFLNVVIYRGPSIWGLLDETAPTRGTLAAPRSYCPHCRAQLKFWNLIPVISYLAAKRTLRQLHQQDFNSLSAGGDSRASLLQPLAFLKFGWGAQTIAAAIFGWFLIALAAD